MARNPSAIRERKPTDAAITGTVVHPDGTETRPRSPGKPKKQKSAAEERKAMQLEAVKNEIKEAREHLREDAAALKNSRAQLKQAERDTAKILKARNKDVADAEKVLAREQKKLDKLNERKAKLAS